MCISIELLFFHIPVARVGQSVSAPAVAHRPNGRQVRVECAPRHTTRLPR